MIPMHVSSNNLERVIRTLKSINNFHGMTITIPHKSEIVKFCDFLEPDAQLTQAVNWIKFDKDRNLIGNNFDGKGFVNGFIGQNNMLANKTVSIFGAGGAAIAIACSIAKENIKEIKLINRNINKAYDIQKKINIINSNIITKVFSTNNYTINDSDIVINATSLGLQKGDNVPFDVKDCSDKAIIADIIMQPAETKLLKQAKSLGRPVHYGKNMIDSQINLVGSFLDLW